MRQFFKVKENVSLAPLTTLRIGGAARFFVTAVTESQVAEAVEFAAKNNLDLFVLGGGSNVLVSDRGFDGLVLQIGLLGVESFEFLVPSSELRGDSNAEPGTRNAKLIKVGAGEDWDEFVENCVKERLSGVECLSGIPGLVGGTPVQNVGAYGQEVSETIVAVRCLDRTNGKIVTLTNADCGFTYRTSIFNSTHRERYIVLAVTFRLVENGPPKIAYPELERAVEMPASLSGVRDAVLGIRGKKSMLIDPRDPNSKSVGSFFKNPIVELEKLKEIQIAFPSVPYFEFGEMVKIPAAWLIENAGFSKGFTLGNAGISENHTLALINRGKSTAAEIIDLKDMIQAGVEARFGITLCPEPVFVGFDA